MRKLLTAIAVILLFLGAGYQIGVATDNTVVAATQAATHSPRMSVAEAHAASKQGDILLVDIRTRREWRETGIAQTALPISMHESSFIEKLDKAISENPGKPVALICAAGVRSNFLRERLLARGYKDVIDVPEGMMGSRAGPGWINSGLPIVHDKR